MNAHTPQDFASVSVPRTVCTCFACGASYLHGRGDGRFSSSRCRDGCDAGCPAHQPYDAISFLFIDFRFRAPLFGKGRAARSSPAPTVAANSIVAGLHCCTKACERALTNAKALQADMGPLAAEPSARRKCEVCEAKLPRWINGKEVRKSQRFCSARCARKSSQTRLEWVCDQNRQNEPDDAKKCLQNKGFLNEAETPSTSASGGVTEAATLPPPDQRQPKLRGGRSDG